MLFLQTCEVLVACTCQMLGNSIQFKVASPPSCHTTDPFRIALFHQEYSDFWCWVCYFHTVPQSIPRPTPIMPHFTASIWWLGVQRLPVYWAYPRIRESSPSNCKTSYRGYSVMALGSVPTLGFTYGAGWGSYRMKASTVKEIFCSLKFSSKMILRHTHIF